MPRLRIWIWVLGMVALCNKAIAQDEKVMFSHQGGFYSESFYLSLGCSDFNHHIRYTTNGNAPTAASPVYEQQLWLSQHLYSHSDIYKLQISPESLQYVPDSVSHVIVIRAAVFDENGQRMGPVATNTYFINALGVDTQGLPAVSICADSLDLFDYQNGIMVPGGYFDANDPYNSGNYYQHGREWERCVNVEFYKPGTNGSVNQQCGLRTHGNRARCYPQKGLKIYAREEYGKKRFKYRFFDTTPNNSFKHLVIKPFTTLWPFSGVQDYVSNRLAMDLALDAPNSCPVRLFLNGEYWGIYFLQEKMDERYLEDHYDVDIEQCNIIDNWHRDAEYGDSANFVNMMEWLENADLSVAENYAYLCGLVDVENFIDYCVFETFIGNTDWPANNMRLWQEGDGKWRWLFYDGDAALIDAAFAVFDNASYMGIEGWPSSTKASLMFRRMFENNDFKRKFADRVESFCASEFRYENTVTYLDEVKNQIAGEIPCHIFRFGYPESVDYWNWSISLVDDFLRHRIDSYRQQYENYLPAKPSEFQSNTDDFVVYSNPADDEIHIKMLDGRSRVTDFLLCDVSGRVIRGGTCYLSACQEIVLGSGLSSGVYIVKIGSYVHRFLKL